MTAWRRQFSPQTQRARFAASRTLDTINANLSLTRSGPRLSLLQLGLYREHRAWRADTCPSQRGASSHRQPRALPALQREGSRSSRETNPTLSFRGGVQAGAGAGAGHHRRPCPASGRAGTARGAPGTELA